MSQKKLRVTVDGKPYEVTVDVPEDAAPPTPAEATPIEAPKSSPPEKPAAAPSHSGDSASLIVSPLAGRVVAITVKVGQKVSEGEHVLTLEAMKMNTFVFPKQGGVVKEIQVAVGDAVQENQTLIVLE